MPDTSTGPTQTVCVGHDGVPDPNGGSAASTNVKPLLLLMPSIATYGNGYEVTGANYGDSNDDEGSIYLCEIQAIHSNYAATSTQHDKTTAYLAGNKILPVRLELNKAYWFKASSITAAKGDKLHCAAAGLVAKQTDHTATALPHHTFVCETAVTSKNYVKAVYIGITSMFTAA